MNSQLFIFKNRKFFFNGNWNCLDFVYQLIAIMSIIFTFSYLAKVIPITNFWEEIGKGVVWVFIFYGIWENIICKEKV